jgi:hypothetical protein
LPGFLAFTFGRRTARLLLFVFPFSLNLIFSEELTWPSSLLFLPFRVTNTILAELHSFTVSAREPLKNKPPLPWRTRIPCGRGQIFSPLAAAGDRSERIDSDFSESPATSFHWRRTAALTIRKVSLFGLRPIRRSTWRNSELHDKEPDCVTDRLSFRFSSFSGLTETSKNRRLAFWLPDSTHGLGTRLF